MGNVPTKEHSGHQRRQSEPVREKESPRNQANSNTNATATTPRGETPSDIKSKAQEVESKTPRKVSETKNPSPRPETKPEEKPRDLNDSAPQTHPDSAKNDKVDTLTNDSDKANFAKQQFDQLTAKTQVESQKVAEITDSIPLELSEEDIRITEFLGEGVYSEVYRGYCYGTQVAVKKFKNQGFDPEVLKEVRKEVRIMKSLHHPNLLLFLGACTKPGHLMIVTELMEKSFHEVAHSKTIDLLSKLKMAKEAAKGISWLHSLSPAIIHRDLKPENILIAAGGKAVKVCDFGLSLVKDHSLQEREEMKRIRGSPAFMSPEALLGSELTLKTDVYSFGVILWELLTGKSPYDDMSIESFDQLIEEICEKGTREKIPEDCPPSLKKLIESCWLASPELRPNFIQIIGQLDDCILESAIGDKEGRRLWKRHFGAEAGMLKYEIPWEHFLNVLSMQLRMSPGLKIFQGLKSMIIKNDSNMVPIDEFGNILKWFGPMAVSEEPENNFIYRMQNLLTKRWFHGDITLLESQTRLAGTDPGSYLIRFSSNPGQYALSKMIENHNKDRVIVHIRISHSPGGKYSFVLDGKVYEYDNLEELVKSPVLGLTKPCQGSKYYAQFRIKQVHSGYVNTVN